MGPYTLTYFGQTINATGTIREALEASNLEVGNNQPYINGVRADFDDTPEAGDRVTFRPAASGKA